METKEIIILLIAIYGAVLSTYLGFRELRKESRRIKILLEHLEWIERAQVTIVNIGHRPITVTEIGMSVGTGDGRTYEDVPRFDLFLKEDEKLPVTLRDGEHVNLLLDEVISHHILSASMDAKINVYDAEGNLYTEFEKRSVDTKWGKSKKI